MMNRKKIVIVGDSGCGKTLLSAKFCKLDFVIGAYLPTISNHFARSLKVDGEEVIILSSIRAFASKTLQS